MWPFFILQPLSILPRWFHSKDLNSLSLFIPILFFISHWFPVNSGLCNISEWGSRYLAQFKRVKTMRVGFNTFYTVPGALNQCCHTFLLTSGPHKRPVLPCLDVNLTSRSLASRSHNVWPPQGPTRQLIHVWCRLQNTVLYFLLSFFLYVTYCYEE